MTNASIRNNLNSTDVRADDSKRLTRINGVLGSPHGSDVINIAKILEIESRLQLFLW